MRGTFLRGGSERGSRVGVVVQAVSFFPGTQEGDVDTIDKVCEAVIILKSIPFNHCRKFKKGQPLTLRQFPPLRHKSVSLQLFGGAFCSYQLSRASFT